MRKLIFAALPLLFVVGCTKTVEEMSYSEQQALAKQIVKRCEAQGVKTNTAQMQQCTGVEAQREIYTRRVRAANEQQRIANASRSLAQTGAAMQPAPPAQSRTYTCTNVPSPAGMTKVRCY